MKKIAIIAALGLFATGAAMAQAKPDPKLGQCRTELARTHTDTLKKHADGLKSGKIDAKEEAAYKTMEAKLRADATKAQKDGISLKECEDLLKEAKAEHAAVEKMLASGPSPVAACVKDFTAEHSVLMKEHQAGLKSGKLSKAEEADFKKMEATLVKHEKEAAKGGLTLKECQDIRAEIKKEHANLKEMLAVNGKVHACFDEFKKTAALADKTIEDGVKAKKVTAQEQAAYKQRDQALDKRYNTAMKDGNITQAECNSLLTAAKNELTVAQRMAAN